MKSPFPGMDPYIEARGLWEDFHSHLVEKIADALAEAVPERYSVQTGVRSYVALVEEGGKTDHLFKPDVGVSTLARLEPGAQASTLTALAAAEPEPVPIRPFVGEEFREKFVEIHEADPEYRLVTSVEVLSPSNKRRGSPGWAEYQRKRQALLLGAANLVEIDLLRGGSRMPMLDPWPSSPFTLFVYRKGVIPKSLAWRASFDRPLPVIPVPLDEPDADIPLHLQPLIDGIYQRYRYRTRIDYSKPLKPPLNAEETAWLQEQIRALPPSQS